MFFWETSDLPSSMLYPVIDLRVSLHLAEVIVVDDHNLLCAWKSIAFELCFAEVLEICNFYAMFGSFEGGESRGEERSGKKSREKWLSSTLFEYF